MTDPIKCESCGFDDQHGLVIHHVLVSSDAPAPWTGRHVYLCGPCIDQAPEMVNYL